MRTLARKTLGTGLVAVGVLTLTLACKESSNMVTAAEVAPAANVAGTWVGTFQSDSSVCASSQITATFQQSGAQVTGTLSGTSCGSSGSIRARATMATWLVEAASSSTSATSLSRP